MKNAENTLKSILCVLGMLLIVPGVILASFDLSALDRNVHQKLYDQLHSAEAAGVNEATLNSIGDMLVAYLKDARDDLDKTAEVFGVRRQVFNEREIAHMQDVKALFLLERRVARLFLWVGAALLILSLPGKGWAKRLRRAGLAAQIFWMLILGGLAGWASMDFDRAFELFHGALFTNDLWLLDPRTDLMIRMLPEKFFIGVAVNALRGIAIGQVVLLALWLCLTAVFRNREKPTL